MPYDFTALGAADITFNVTTTGFADNRTAFVAGWFKPNGLTDTMRLWSFNNFAGLRVNSTGDLVLDTTNATTNGQYRVDSAEFTDGEWNFVAMLASTENTGALCARRFWTGKISEAPVERATTELTAAVGNFTGSAQFYIGNLGTAGALSFGGSIADVSVITTDAAYGITTHPFGLVTSGVIADAQALRVYEALVLPLWLGDRSVLWNRWAATTPTVAHWAGDVGAVYDRRPNNGVHVRTTATVNTATSSLEAAPRPQVRPVMLSTLPMVPRRR